MQIKKFSERSDWMAFQRGYTLIEIMMVIALMIAITAIAVSSYTQYLYDSRRAVGVAVLHEVRQSLERHYAKRFAFTNLVPGDTFPAKSPKDGTAEYYRIQVDVSDDNQDFTIVAVASGIQAPDKCGDLSLNRQGVYQNSKGLDNNDCF